MKKILLSLAILLAGYTSSFADFADTVWVRKTQDNGRLQFSPDDSKILTIGGSAIIFDTQTGNVLKQLNGYGDGQYSSDGTTLLLAKEIYDTNKQVHPVIDIYDATSYEKTKSITLGIVKPGSTHVKLSNDGKTIAVVNDTKITFVDFATGDVKKILGDFDNNTGISYRIMDFLFTKDDNDLIIAIISGNKGESGSLQYINTSTYQKDFEGTQKTNKLAISNDGTMIAFNNLNANSNVQILNVFSKGIIGSIPGNESDILGLTFSSDSKRLAVCFSFSDSTLKIFDLIKYQQIKAFTTYPNGYGLFSPHFSNNSDLIVANSGTYLYLYKLSLTSIINQNNIIKQTIYPNPTNGIVTINTNCILPQLQYSISNQAGQIINTSITQNVNNQIQLNFSQYQSGTYFIRLQCNQEVSNFKLIKE